MAWTIEYTDSAKRELKKLDKQTARSILDYMDVVGALEDVRSRGKRLSGPLGDLWRYRVGDYRVICKIQDTRLVTVVVRIGHRKEVYLN